MRVTSGTMAFSTTGRLAESIKATSGTRAFSTTRWLSEAVRDINAVEYWVSFAVRLVA